MTRSAFIGASVLAAVLATSPSFNIPDEHLPGSRPHPKPQHPAPEQGPETRQQRRARERAERKRK